MFSKIFCLSRKIEQKLGQKKILTCDKNFQIIAREVEPNRSGTVIYDKNLFLIKFNPRVRTRKPRNFIADSEAHYFWRFMPI